MGKRRVKVGAKAEGEGEGGDRATLGLQSRRLLKPLVASNIQPPVAPRLQRLALALQTQHLDVATTDASAPPSPGPAASAAASAARLSDIVIAASASAACSGCLLLALDLLLEQLAADLELLVLVVHHLPRALPHRRELLAAAQQLELEIAAHLGRTGGVGSAPARRVAGSALAHRAAAFNAQGCSLKHTGLRPPPGACVGGGRRTLSASSSISSMTCPARSPSAARCCCQASAEVRCCAAATWLGLGLGVRVRVRVIVRSGYLESHLELAHPGLQLLHSGLQRHHLRRLVGVRGWGESWG
eukprot:scaffold53367_cov54-Phaeocystis_antarctica.AAC.1